MILSICGFNGSGSSAVIDLLKEYENANVIDFECMMLDLPDGIRDLDYAFHDNGTYFRVDRALLRFQQFVHRHRYLQEYSDRQIDALTSHYIEALASIRWQGRSIYDYVYYDGIYRYGWFCKRLIEKIVYQYVRKRLPLTNRCMRMPDRGTDFYAITRNYMDSVVECFGGKHDMINVFDQLMPPVGTEDYIKYVNNGYAIVVYRDPRDMYINYKKDNVDSRFAPMAVGAYINHFDSFCARISELHNTPSVLLVQYEDLIYRYDETLKKIESFVPLGEHTKPRTTFNPDISIDYTQLFKRLPEFADDVRKIEMAEKDFLYDFPDSDIVNKEFENKIMWVNKRSLFQ